MSFTEVQTRTGSRVTVNRVWACSSMGLYGRVRTLRPGDEFQLRAVIRTSLGNYHAIIAVESYDPYLGRYTTPESTCYRLPLEMIEELT